MKMVKRMGSLVLLASMILTLFGCASSKVNYEVPVFSEEDVIYRGAWWCPKPTEENYKVYQECGLNTIFLANHNFLFELDGLHKSTGKSYEQLVYENSYFIGHSEKYDVETQTDKALKLCKDMGMKIYLAEGSSYFQRFDLDIDVCEDFEINYDGYEDTIVGLFAGDEPNKPEIYELAKNIKKAEKVMSDVPYFANLFPSYANERTVLQADSYKDYVDTYNKEFLGELSGPRLLSVDYYPFQGSNFYNYAQCYDILTDYVKENNARFHTFIQIQEEYTPGIKIVNEQDVRLQVNTALAYGATEYSYFLYDTAVETPYGGMITEDGEKSAQYNHAKVVNHEIETLEHAFMHYRHEWTTALYPVDNSYGILTPLVKDWEEIEDSSKILKDAVTDNCVLVSLFKDKDGNEAYYIVNFYEEGQDDPGEASHVTLEFKRMKNVTLYGSKNRYDGEKKSLENHKFDLHLEPGDGLFVVPSVK